MIKISFYMNLLNLKTSECYLSLRFTNYLPYLCFEKVLKNSISNLLTNHKINGNLIPRKENPTNSMTQQEGIWFRMRRIIIF
jgi:hypothetical protein